MRYVWINVGINKYHFIKKVLYLMQKNNDLYAIIIYEDNRFDMEVMSSE